LITGELKSEEDKVWDAFWTGGIFNHIIKAIENLDKERNKALKNLKKVLG